MGGAINVPGNLLTFFTPNMQNTEAEWNIWVDPEAAKIVFDSSSYLTFIPLDATRYVEVTNEYVNEFNKIEQNSVLMEFVAKIFTSYSFLINSAEEEGGYSYGILLLLV